MAASFSRMANWASVKSSLMIGETSGGSFWKFWAFEEFVATRERYEMLSPANLEFVEILSSILSKPATWFYDDADCLI